MVVPFYRIVRFTGPDTFEATGEEWPYAEDFEGLHARLAQLTTETGQPHGAELIWA